MEKRDPNLEALKRYPTDEKMIELMYILKEAGKIRFKKDFADALEIPRQNIRSIEVLKRWHFTADHIRLVCEVFGVNANWIMGLEKEVFRRVRKPEEPVTKTLTIVNKQRDNSKLVD